MTQNRLICRQIVISLCLIGLSIGFGFQTETAYARVSLTDLQNQINDLQDQINNIQLTPGPQGPQGEIGPQGPPGESGNLSDDQIDFLCTVSEQLGIDPPADVDCAKIVFVTSTKYTGNLGGVAGADAKCQDRAYAAGLPGTYKAWISDSSGTPSTRFNKSTFLYVRVDGALVANSWTDLIDGSIINPISITVFGTTQTGAWPQLAWTDTKQNGTRGWWVDCNNWTSSSGSGYNGIITSVNYQWSLMYGVTCSRLNHLYCFQQ